MDAKVSLGALVSAVLWLGAAPAMATPANLDPVFGFVASDLDGLSTRTIDRDDPFLAVNDVNLGIPAPVLVAGSDPTLGQVCILLSGDSACRSSAFGATEPYSVLVSVEVVSVTGSEITGPFLLVLSGLPQDETIFSQSDLYVELDPTAPSGLDTTGAPGFEFDGTFDPFLHVIDLDTTAPIDRRYDYIGWQVQLGDVVTFRYEVTNPDLATGAVPFLAFNAIPVIPEPGTGLLMGLGLAGLASVRRPRVADAV
jgi:hypothetical protein